MRSAQPQPLPADMARLPIDWSRYRAKVLAGQSPIVAVGDNGIEVRLQPGVIEVWGGLDESTTLLVTELIWSLNLVLPLAIEGSQAFIFYVNAQVALRLSRQRSTERQALPFAVNAINAAPPGAPILDLWKTALHGLRLRGQFSDARGVAEQALQSFPGNAELLMFLGDMYQRLGDLDRASAAYEPVVASGIAKGPSASAVRVLLRPEVIWRFFGETAAKLDLYVKAQALGLIPAARTVLPVNASQVANPHYLRYWDGMVDLVDIDAMAAIRAQDPVYFHTDYYRVPDGRCLRRDLAHSIVQGLWEAENRPPLLRLTDQDRQRCRRTLSTMGVPEDAWLVALHVRQGGFHNEIAGEGLNAFRNAEITTYLPAIRAITARGGWVVRLGDASMSRLPQIDHVIDYAHSSAKSDWMDVALIAESRLFLGMASGPSSAAVTFGVPTLGTNWFPMGYWPYCTGDMVLPKLILREDGSPLTIKEALAPALFGAFEPELFARERLQVRDNSADELEAATIEMLDRLDGKAAIANPEAVRTFERHADPFRIGLRAGISPAFLAKHPGLLRGLS